MTASSKEQSSKNPRWHYQPEVPVQTSPLFARPINPKKVVRWFFNGWFPLSENILVLALAILSWALFHPSLTQATSLQLDWVAMIFFRNLALITIVAGGLHLYFYVYRKQSDELHYDVRPLSKKNRAYTFNNQVKDNIFWSCVSGVSIWTAYEVLMMWSMANGHIPTLTWSDDAGWIVLLIFLIPIWETFYFYLVHRMLHWPLMYKHVHYLHHRNTNIGPWSGLSMHPIEHIIYLGSVCIHWVVPANPLIIIYHLQHYTLTAATTHTGYQGVVRKNKLLLALGTFHHQMHHRFYECNYGGLEIPMDKWAGSFNDGTEGSHQAFMQRRRKSKTT